MTEVLKDKVAIVTGASRGIGQAIAVAMAQQGAKVVLSASSVDNLTETEQLIKAAGHGACILTQANVSIGDEVNEVVKIALDTYGKIDILVNNAGATKDNLLALMPETDWDYVLSTNLKSVFLFCKACSRPMVKQRSGSIINISSVVGITGNAGQANYAASKAAIIGFTKSVAKELAKRNIRANAIAPGFIRTRMTDQLPANVQDKVKEQIALGRFGEVQDIAQVAVFLASDAASYMTGQTLVVDGGLVI
ncbi:MAG TPA: 3-oxoacyl-[acyl-carrier-protein] reductase [Verrucomicrobiae bacterium]|jgi:3-oxoacyl-[acyl-carrier protein] reductase|nr:3-oxoacyl-[acyl-carrier-protein] reductase [Verrucomicrobiae bacterium]